MERAGSLAGGDVRIGRGVTNAEVLWCSRAITAVPALVMEGKYLISGGQLAAVFEGALGGFAE